MEESNITIAQKTKLEPIQNIAKKVGLTEEDLFLYGPYTAKVNASLLKGLKNKDGKLILVTAITPTKAGEGKSTTVVGLAQGLAKLGKKAMICLREPSLGPCFGVKGGASGGGYSQVLPMEDINLHFTGDIHAISAANNLLAAVIDNHIVQGNNLNINPDSVVWRRALDMNDRTLRNIYVGCDERKICLRSDTFDITAASEVMAVLCLAEDLKDLKNRINRIIVAYSYNGKPIYARELKVAGAMAALLKHAINPNLVQSTEKVPAFVHGGPFANIAHGCNSLIATKLALKLADYIVTEAGFGADLGAEKFFNIKCRIGKLKPNAIVLVSTIRALEMHGKGDLKSGLCNLERHIGSLREFNVPLVVSLNKFSGDDDLKIKIIGDRCGELNVDFVVADPWNKGGEGCADLTRAVLDIIDGEGFNFLYESDLHIKDKIGIISTKIYGADGVDYTKDAERHLGRIESLNLDRLPVCMAKTQMSLSDNPSLIGRPVNFRITVRDIKVSAGAGFIVVMTGKILTMPGLPRIPNAEAINIDDDGKISGLF